MKDFPLHQACMNNQLDKVKQLVSDSENVRIALREKDNDARTPLHWAVSFQNEEIVTYLLEHMKSTDLDDLTDESGWTPFHIACSVGNYTIVEQLYNRDIKPDINLQTNQGTTALHLAVAKSHYSVIELLLENGANLQIKDKKNQIPLHRAAAIGSMKLVELLCTKGSPVNWQDITGWSPLFHALAEGHGDVAALLVSKYNASPDLEDHSGKKPIDVALNNQVRDFFTKNI